MPRRSQRGNLARGTQDGRTWAVQTEGLPRAPVPTGNHSITVVKNCDAGTVLTTSSTVVSVGSLAFTLDMVSDYASYTAIFDQYRVDDLEVWITPTEDTKSDYINYGKSRYASVIDRDDSTNLAALSDALEYDNAVCSTVNVGHYRHFKPRIALAAYSGAFTSYANFDPTWIDCGSATVKHYGVKLVCEVVDLPVAMAFKALVRVKLSFRGTR